MIFFSEENNTWYSCELSARQTIHMKCQALFYLKKIKLLSALVVIGTLRIKMWSANISI